MSLSWTEKWNKTFSNRINCLFFTGKGSKINTITNTLSVCAWLTSSVPQCLCYKLYKLKLKYTPLVSEEYCIDGVFLGNLSCTVNSLSPSLRAERTAKSVLSWRYRFWYEKEALTMPRSPVELLIVMYCVQSVLDSYQVSRVCKNPLLRARITISRSYITATMSICRTIISNHSVEQLYQTCSQHALLTDCLFDLSLICWRVIMAEQICMMNWIIFTI